MPILPLMGVTGICFRSKFSVKIRKMLYLKNQFYYSDFIFSSWNHFLLVERHTLALEF